MKKLTSLLVVLFAAILLVGCAPKNPEAAEKKLEDAGYTVTVDKQVQPGVYKVLGIDGVDAVVSAVRANEATEEEEGSIDTIYAVYFGDKADANEAFDTLEDEAKDKDESFSIEKSGNWIFYGSEQGMKDFK